MGWQFTGIKVLDEVYVPFFGALGAAWDDAMVARWSVNPVGMLWPEMNAAFVTSGGGMGPAGHSAASEGPRPGIGVIIARQGAEAIHRADCCGGIREWCSAMS